MTSSEQRGSARRCRVCGDRPESSISSDASGAVAGVTSEAKGWPASLVASVAGAGGPQQHDAPRAAGSGFVIVGHFYLPAFRHNVRVTNVRGPR